MSYFLLPLNNIDTFLHSPHTHDITNCFLSPELGIYHICEIFRNLLTCLSYDCADYINPGCRVMAKTFCFLLPKDKCSTVNDSDLMKSLNWFGEFEIVQGHYMISD